MIRKPLDNEIANIYRLYKQRNYKTEVISYDINDFYLYMDNILVSIIDDKLIGFILYYDMGAWCFIDLLSVDKKYRNKGIGGELVNYLSNINNNWKNIFTCVITDDNQAEAFVIKNGFKKNNQLVNWFYRKN